MLSTEIAKCQMRFHVLINELKYALKELNHLRNEYWQGEIPPEIAERHINLRIKINELTDLLTFKNK